MIYLPQKTPIVKFLKNSLILTPSLINLLTGLRTDGDGIPLEVVNWSQVPSYLLPWHNSLRWSKDRGRDRSAALQLVRKSFLISNLMAGDIFSCLETTGSNITYFSLQTLTLRFLFTGSWPCIGTNIIDSTLQTQEKHCRAKYFLNEWRNYFLSQIH